MFDDRGDSTRRGGGGAVDEVFALCISRVHEMDVGVDHPRHYQQSSCIDLVARGGNIADGD